MDFEVLLKKISPALERIARSHRRCGFFIDEDDLYQEMCIYLWDNFKDGVPEGINEAYVVKGCEFHALNILRKGREKVVLLSLEEPVGEDGDTLKDILPGYTKEPLDRCIDRELAIEEIKSNGFSKREKEVFSLLLEGYTVREAGEKLGISHVMVVKFKQRIIKKWQRRDKIKVTKKGRYLLNVSRG